MQQCLRSRVPQNERLHRLCFFSTPHLSLPCFLLRSNAKNLNSRFSYVSIFTLFSQISRSEGFAAIQAMRFQREEAAAAAYVSEKPRFPTVLINPHLPRSPMTTVIPRRKRTNRAVYRYLLSCVTIR